MPREVTDREDTRWSCIQAYAGLNDSDENRSAAQVDTAGTRVAVVCTPSGGARSVRLELAADWEDSLADEDLLSEIGRALKDLD